MNREEAVSRFEEWLVSWNNHDLEKVMEILHDQVVFERWTNTTTKGKSLLKKSWTPWFLNHGNFKFTRKDLFFDEEQQTMTFVWGLEWPSLDKIHFGKPEVRQGVDILYFKNGKIIKKQSFSKTIVIIDNKLQRVAW